jgi:hypothetical protein
MLKALDSYNWEEVFGEGSGGNCTPIVPNRSPTDRTTPIDTFKRNDVLLICGQQEGENDGRDWIVWGKLKDGRWFVARAGCDYTGWYCQAHNSGDVASSIENIIQFGMSEDERSRFGCAVN